MQSHIISFLLGIICSFIVWGVLNFLIVPKVKFSENIGKIESKRFKSGIEYRFKIENSGRRSIIDIKLQANIKIRGLRDDFPNNWTIKSIPLSRQEIVELISVKKQRKINKKAKKKYGKNFVRQPLGKRVIYFNISKIDLSFSNFPKKISDNTESIILEDLFNLDSKAELVISGYGYDDFSGTKKSIKSKTYKIEDIKEGKFERDTLKIFTI